jgi:hypothetical protein
LSSLYGKLVVFSVYKSASAAIEEDLGVLVWSTYFKELLWPFASAVALKLFWLVGVSKDDEMAAELKPVLV